MIRFENIEPSEQDSDLTDEGDRTYHDSIVDDDSLEFNQLNSVDDFSFPPPIVLFRCLCKGSLVFGHFLGVCHELSGVAS